MILSYSFVVLRLLQPTQELDIPGWVALPGPPSEHELKCTDYSLNFWSVSLTDGRIRPVPCPIREHVDPLPFVYEPGKDRSGNRYVRRLSDGWLVGFDDGEFGGGLWWFSPDGRKSHRLRPAPGTLASPEDPLPAENVLGLPAVGEEQFVLMGLDHLNGRSGRVFRVVSKKPAWKLVPVAMLDSEPDPWFVDGDRLLIATQSGIWALKPTGHLTKLHEIEIGRFSPSALVRGPNGALYLGLRHYVLRLARTGDNWSETWLVPVNCTNVRMVDYRCVCVP